MSEGRALLDRLRGARAHASDGGDDGQPAFTLMQNALIAAHDLNPGQGVSTVHRSWRLSGPLALGAMQRALVHLTARHDGLRMRVERDTGPARPVFGDAVEAAFEVGEAPNEDEARRLVARHARKTAPLDADRLWSALIVRIDAQTHLLSVLLHHIVSDHWSRLVLIRDLLAFYDAEVDGTAPDLPACGGLRQYMVRTRAEPATAPLTLPEPDWPGRFEPSGGDEGALTVSADAHLEAASFDRLRDAARLYEATPSALCTAAYGVLIGAFCDQTRFGMSFSAADRPAPQDRDAIGAFIRDLPLEFDLEGDLRFVDLLRRTRTAMSGLRADRAAPMAASRAAIGYYNAPTKPARSRHLAVSDERPPDKAQSVHLHLSLTPTREGLSIRLDGQRQHFSEAALAAMVAAYRRLLEQVARAPDIRLADIALASPEEAGVQALRSIVPPPESPDHDLASAFRRVAAAHPADPALMTPARLWSYRDLDRDTDNLARWLIGQGLAPGERIAVAMPRGSAVFRTWLGALKAGLTVVPVDSDLPEARVAHLLAGARCDASISLPGDRSRGGSRPLVLPTTLPEMADTPLPQPDGDTPAFVMFTSGTTGLPKAIPVPHAGLLRLAHGASYLPVGPGDRMIQLASSGFDGSFIEVWVAWLRGAELALGDKHIFADGGVEQEFRRLKPTASFLTTSLFNMLVDGDPTVFASLRYLSIGGEAASGAHCRRALAANPTLALHNGYGPTENASFTTSGQVAPDVGAAVPIGTPLPGNMAFVLSDALRPVPDGFAGELVIGGVGLAPAYENRPDATAERFVTLNLRDLGAGPDRLVRLYRTGDRVRWLPDGSLDCLGRRDGQFKLNGHRVEPTEIEAALMEHPDIGRAAVLPARDASARVTGVVAFLEPRAQSVPEDRALRSFLAARLPRPVLPARYVTLDHLPLTANGKADVAALSDHPALKPAKAQAGTAGPRSGDALGAIWTHALNVAEAPEDAEFFNLGGTSMDLVRMILDVERAYGVSIDFSSFAEEATLRRLRLLVAMSPAEREAGDTSHIRVLRQCDPSRAPLVILPLANGQVMWAVDMLNALTTGRTVLGLTFDRRETIGAPEGTVAYAALVSRLTQALATRCAGQAPILVGFSFGGTLATHIAAEAAGCGFEIDKIISLDSASALDWLVPHMLRADASDPFMEGFYLHPAALLEVEMHHLRALRSFPIAMSDEGAHWPNVLPGGLSEYDIDTYHGMLMGEADAARVADLISAILSGRAVPDRRRPGAPDPDALAWANEVKAAIGAGHFDMAETLLCARVPAAGAVPEHVAIALVSLLHHTDQAEALAVFAGRIGDAATPAVFHALARAQPERARAFTEKGFHASGEALSGALPLMRMAIFQGRDGQARVIASRLRESAPHAIEAGIANGLLRAHVGDGQGALSAMLAALDDPQSVKLHALWCGNFLIDAGYWDEAAQFIDAKRTSAPDFMARLSAKLDAAREGPRRMLPVEKPASPQPAKTKRRVRAIMARFFG